jgi:hypothetical protein
MRIKVNIRCVHANAVADHVPNTLRQHLTYFIWPNIGLNVDKNVGIESVDGGVPLMGEISIVANVLPMGAAGSVAIVRINYDGLAMATKHPLQPDCMLLFTWPVEYESLYFHVPLICLVI